MLSTSTWQPSLESMDREDHDWTEVDDAFVKRWDSFIMSRLRAAKVQQAYIEDTKTAVYMRLLNSFSYDPDRGPFSTWLGWVIRSVVSNETKKRIHGSDALDQLDNMELAEAGNIIGQEDAGTPADELDRVFSRTILSKRDKQMVRDKHLKGLTQRELSEKYGLSEGSIEVTLVRAMKALRLVAEA